MKAELIKKLVKKAYETSEIERKFLLPFEKSFQGNSLGRDEVDYEIIDFCREWLRREIIMFRRITEKEGCPVPVETIASHGHAINRAFGFPNNNLVTSDLYDSSLDLQRKAKGIASFK